jgi:hypothetical protein
MFTPPPIHPELRRIRSEIAECKSELQLVHHVLATKRPRTKYETSYALFRFKHALTRLEDLERKANFNPAQLRIPKDSPGGGRWTSPGGVSVTTSDGFLTGISRIDETSQALSDTLVRVMETMNFIPESTPQLYGTAVHSVFAASVRFQDFPGIGYWDVERTFSLEDSDPRYGMAGSIRTDVVLRNDQGNIIAIYDVKTGDTRLSHARANELRIQTGAEKNTPVFELNIVRGITRKYAGSTNNCSIHRSQLYY